MAHGRIPQHDGGCHAEASVTWHPSLRVCSAWMNDRFGRRAALRGGQRMTAVGSPSRRPGDRVGSTAEVAGTAAALTATGSETFERKGYVGLAAWGRELRLYKVVQPCFITAVICCPSQCTKHRGLDQDLHHHRADRDGLIAYCHNNEDAWTAMHLPDNPHFP